MSAMLSVGLLAILLGMRHATDPDHVAAVATIVSRQRSVWAACRVGAEWGLGHSLTLIVVGTTLIAFRLTVPPRLGLAMSAAVGLMLVSLGVASLRSAPRAFAVSGDHRHGLNAHPGDGGLPRRGARAALVGVVHGLDGTAAVTLAALAAMRESEQAILYLVVFGVGTLVGMTLVTAAVAIPSVYAVDRVRVLQRTVRVAAGVLSVAYGAVLLHRAIVDGGLLGATPHWTPA
jgi:cytochrome c biogenesis protein CcdA